MTDCKEEDIKQEWMIYPSPSVNNEEGKDSVVVITKDHTLSCT